MPPAIRPKSHLTTRSCSGRTAIPKRCGWSGTPSRWASGDLLKLFLGMHDPTQAWPRAMTPAAQYRFPGPDRDPQRDAASTCPASRPPYRASSRPQVLEKSPRRSWRIAPFFLLPKPIHQQYLARPGSRPYCFPPAQAGVRLTPFQACLPAGAKVLGAVRLVRAACAAAQALTTRYRL